MILNSNIKKVILDKKINSKKDSKQKSKKKTKKKTNKKKGPKREIKLKLWDNDFSKKGHERAFSIFIIRTF